jgi:uncharacterized protein (DUF58 family)
MSLYKRFIQPLFFSRRFFWILAGFVFLFIVSFIVTVAYPVLQLCLLAFALIAFVDYLSLFIIRQPVKADRLIADRLSNGDENPVSIRIRNNYPFRIFASVIDELPEQFQMRNFLIRKTIASREEMTLPYQVRPVERGEYQFYDIRVFAKSPLGLIIRRVTIPAEKQVKVMPSFLSLRQFELKAHSSNLVEAGNRKVRKIGHSLEFEQIRDYVMGDDIRTVNWKATARKGQIMVNNYTDEKSQQVYCIIDKGRVMKMPFEGMTLLDYAINASLALLRVALIRQDRAGLITFDENIGHVVPADHKIGQMTHILEALYNQQTRFMESDYEKLHALLRTRVSQRSLVVLFTNFESLSSLHRQLPYMRSIARNHLLLVVFFENTELRQLTEMPANDLESLYTRTIAEKFAYEKRLIVKELQQHGIFTILTAPSDLTINTVNKYLELKARQAI